MEKVIVTRHKSLIALLLEWGVVEEASPVLTHVSNAEEIRGKHVFGVLPLHLAALAAKVTEIPLEIPAELRGTELSTDLLREMAAPPRTYEVRRVDG